MACADQRCRLRKNIPADAAVLTDIPQAFFLYTSRRAALTDASDAPSAARHALTWNTIS